MSSESRHQRRDAARAEREAAERAAAQAQQRRTRLLQLGGVLLGAAVIVVAVVLLVGGGSNGKPAKKAGEQVAGQTDIRRQLAGIPQSGITLGRKTAPVTLVEFGDLQCPVCAAFSNQVTPTIVNDYIRPGKARMEFRNISFIGPDSERLAQMGAAAAQQNKLYDFAELVYANQGQENSGYATDDFLRKIGSAVPGLDVEKAMSQRNDAATTQQLADAERLSKINGVTGTPTFLVGRTGGTLKTVDAQRLPTELAKLTKQAPPQQ